MPYMAASTEMMTAIRAGDEAAFTALVARHRRELHVHCYRMLGSFDDAEDVVQETFFRAWRSRHGIKDGLTVRAWLYRIATNACLSFLDRHRRQPQIATPATDRVAEQRVTVPWLQPYPDALLDDAASGTGEPDAVVVSKETIELAFLVAIQHLPPKQRAALILRDVLGWPATETAASLEMSVTAVKSALQRARGTLRTQLPRNREDWMPAPSATDEERAILRRYVAAHEDADPAALAALLRADARMTMPPEPGWYVGREAVVELWSAVMVGPQAWGQWRSLATWANRHPAVAHYLRRPDQPTYRAANLDVLRVESGEIVEITGFDARTFAAFDLALEL
jgi:RNA polymerase sigma-70 factor (ECF subfamily)